MEFDRHRDANEPTATEAGALSLLGDFLAAEGFSEWTAFFNPLAPAAMRWETMVPWVPNRLRSVHKLFLLGDSIDPGELPGTLKALVPLLLRLGLLASDANGRIRTPGLVLIPVMGNWLFCQRPQPNPRVYFGDDSMALLTRILPRTGGECLDLCAGPGLHALHMARFARKVTAVEIDPAAAQLAVYNAAINRLSANLTVIQGDLFQSLPGQTFDTIVANPPLLPYPDRLVPPNVGDAGSDGFKIHRRILKGLPRALKEGGHAQLIGLSFSDGHIPLVNEDLARLAEKFKLDIGLSMVAHYELDRDGWLFPVLVNTLMAISGKNEDRVIDAWEGLMREQKASHLCPCFIHAKLGQGRFETLSAPPSTTSTFWFA